MFLQIDRGFYAPVPQLGRLHATPCAPRTLHSDSRLLGEAMDPAYVRTHVPFDLLADIVSVPKCIRKKAPINFERRGLVREDGTTGASTGSRPIPSLVDRRPNIGWPRGKRIDIEGWRTGRSSHVSVHKGYTSRQPPSAMVHANASLYAALQPPEMTAGTHKQVLYLYNSLHFPSATSLPSLSPFKFRHLCVLLSSRSACAIILLLP